MECVHLSGVSPLPRVRRGITYLGNVVLLSVGMGIRFLCSRHETCMIFLLFWIGGESPTENRSVSIVHSLMNIYLHVGNTNLVGLSLLQTASYGIVDRNIKHGMDSPLIVSV